VMHAASFNDERQMITAAVQRCVASSLAPIDEPIFIRGLLEHFGHDAFVPMPTPYDFWNAAATKISRVVTTRHGSLCMPVLESEEMFVMAVLEEESVKLGATIHCMSGRLSGLSQLSLIGGMVNGQWRDGCFTTALRDVLCCEQPGWLVVFCGQGKFEQEQWESLHTLLDDNKCLRLESGECISLRPDDRIIFAAQNVDGASPATMSRLGIVNLDAHHRHRL